MKKINHHSKKDVPYFSRDLREAGEKFTLEQLQQDIDNALKDYQQNAWEPSEPHIVSKYELSIEASIDSLPCLSVHYFREETEIEYSARIKKSDALKKAAKERAKKKLLLENKKKILERKLMKDPVYVEYKKISNTKKK